MKMKFHWIAAIALAALAGTAKAQMGPPGHGPLGWMGGEDLPEFRLLMKAAHLTPDQKAQIRDILKGDRGQMRPIVGQIRALREQIAAKLAGTAPVGLEDFQPIEKQISALREQAAQHALGLALKIRALLTPEQLQHVAAFQQKFASLHDQMRELMQSEGMGPGGGPGCPMMGGAPCPMMGGPGGPPPGSPPPNEP